MKLGLRSPLNALMDSRLRLIVHRGAPLNAGLVLIVRRGAPLNAGLVLIVHRGAPLDAGLVLIVHRGAPLNARLVLVIEGGVTLHAWAIITLLEVALHIRNLRLPLIGRGLQITLNVRLRPLARYVRGLILLWPGLLGKHRSPIHSGGRLIQASVQRLASHPSRKALERLLGCSGGRIASGRQSSAYFNFIIRSR
jgi:hypothetical protein